MEPALFSGQLPQRGRSGIPAFNQSAGKTTFARAVAGLVGAMRSYETFVEIIGAGHTPETLLWFAS